MGPYEARRIHAGQWWRRVPRETFLFATTLRGPLWKTLKHCTFVDLQPINGVFMFFLTMANHQVSCKWTEASTCCYGENLIFMVCMYVPTFYAIPNWVCHRFFIHGYSWGSFFNRLLCGSISEILIHLTTFFTQVFAADCYFGVVAMLLNALYLDSVSCGRPQVIVSKPERKHLTWQIQV